MSHYPYNPYDLNETYYTPGRAGYDLDEETVKLFDSILVNIATDPELRHEFKKMQFIKTLEGKAPKGPGPIQQLLEKTAKLERNYLDINMDLRRVISDMQHMERQLRGLRPEKALTAKDVLREDALHDLDTLRKYNILQEGKQK